MLLRLSIYRVINLRSLLQSIVNYPMRVRTIILQDQVCLDLHLLRQKILANIVIVRRLGLMLANLDPSQAVPWKA